MAARSVLLKHLRVAVKPLPHNPNLNSSVGLSFNVLRRLFSEELRGSFLDKSEVTDRVVSVVKNFQKVDPSKVLSPTISLLAHFLALPVPLLSRGKITENCTPDAFHLDGNWELPRFLHISVSLVVLIACLFSDIRQGISNCLLG